MKKILIAMMLLKAATAQAQHTKVIYMTLTTHKCPIDTVKGLLYYRDYYFTQDFIDTGYYIAPCGGIRIQGYNEYPTWIPGTFIRNDATIHGKRRLGYYYTQQNSGEFTDKNFKPINKARVHGLLLLKN